MSKVELIVRPEDSQRGRRVVLDIKTNRSQIANSLPSDPQVGEAYSVTIMRITKRGTVNFKDYFVTVDKITS